MRRRASGLTADCRRFIPPAAIVAGTEGSGLLIFQTYAYEGGADCGKS